MDARLEKLGQLIKVRREQLGWNQARLAEKLGVSQPSVNQYESSKKLPSIEILLQLSDALGISTDQLLGLPSASPTDTSEASIILTRFKALNHKARPVAIKLIAALEELDWK